MGYHLATGKGGRGTGAEPAVVTAPWSGARRQVQGIKASRAGRSFLDAGPSVVHPRWGRTGQKASDVGNKPLNVDARACSRVDASRVDTGRQGARAGRVRTNPGAPRPFAPQARRDICRQRREQTLSACKAPPCATRAHAGRAVTTGRAVRSAVRSGSTGRARHVLPAGWSRPSAGGTAQEPPHG